MENEVGTRDDILNLRLFWKVIFSGGGAPGPRHKPTKAHIKFLCPGFTWKQGGINICTV